MKSVFISYCNLDQDKVTHLSKRLKNTRQFNPIVVAARKNPGKLLTGKVEDGIKESEIFVPILTGNSFREQWVNQELGYAVALNKKIRPIVEISIINVLKGFFHAQLDLPYQYHASDDAKVEKKNYRKACTDLLAELTSDGRESKDKVSAGNFKIVAPRESEVAEEWVRVSGVGAPPKHNIMLFTWLNNKSLTLQKDIAKSDADGKWNNQQCQLKNINRYREIWAIAVSDGCLKRARALAEKVRKHMSPVDFHKALIVDKIPNTISAGKKLIRTGGRPTP